MHIPNSVELQGFRMRLNLSVVSDMHGRRLPKPLRDPHGLQQGMQGQHACQCHATTSLSRLATEHGRPQVKSLVGIPNPTQW